MFQGSVEKPVQFNTSELYFRGMDNTIEAF